MSKQKQSQIMALRRAELREQQQDQHRAHLGRNAQSRGKFGAHAHKNTIRE
ncbi:MAG: hypothetical protein IKE14_14015 [Loktanella sp.]|nr:hypothetical protein [Loktanella sp.]